MPHTESEGDNLCLTLGSLVRPVLEKREGGIITLVGWFGKCPMQKARPVFKIIALKPEAWGGGPCGHLRLQMSGLFVDA